MLQPPYWPHLAVWLWFSKLNIYLKGKSTLFVGLKICRLYLLQPDIGIMVRVCASGPGDLGSISGWIIPKTQKMVLDATLLNTQHYKVRIKGKVEQSRERSSALPLHLGVVAIEKGAFGSPSTTVTNFTFTTLLSLTEG